MLKIGTKQRCLIFSFIVIGMLALFFSWTFISTHTLNSDSIVPETILVDIANGTDLSGWKMPTSSFIIPDWPIWFGLRSITSIAITFFIFSFLMFFSTFVWIKQEFVDEPWFLPKTITAILIWSIIFHKEWWVLATPVHHGTAMVIGLWLSHYYLKFSKTNYFKGCLFVLSAAVITASDAIFGLWFLLPLGLTTLFFRKLKFNKALLGILILLLSYLFYRLFVFMSSVKNENGLNNLFFYGPVHTFTLFFLYMKTHFFVTFAFALSIFLSFRKRSRLNVFFILSFFCTLTFIILAGQWRDDHSVRYFLPYSFLVTIILTNQLFMFKSRFLKLSLLTFVFIFSFAIMINKLRITPLLISEDQRSVDCVDNKLHEKGLINEAGLATYWTYKMNKALSEYPLSMQQIHSNWRKHDILINSFWVPKTFVYKYLIISSNETMLTVEHNVIGETIDCGKFQLILPLKGFYLFN